MWSHQHITIHPQGLVPTLSARFHLPPSATTNPSITRITTIIPLPPPTTPSRAPSSPCQQLLPLSHCQPLRRSNREWRWFSCHHRPPLPVNNPSIARFASGGCLLATTLRRSNREQRRLSCHYHPLTVDSPSVAQFASGGCFFATTTPLQLPTPTLPPWLSAQRSPLPFDFDTMTPMGHLPSLSIQNGSSYTAADAPLTYQYIV